MAYKTQNIIVGAAAVFVSVADSTGTGFFGTAGETLAAIPAIGSNNTTAEAVEKDTKWRHVGFTTNGVEFSYEPDFGEVTVDQSLDAAKMFKQGQKASVKTTLAEATLENLLLAWGQATSTLDEGAEEDVLGISSGDLGDEPVERSVLFIGQAPRKIGVDKRRERIYLLRRALNVESSAHSLQRTDATTIPVSFRCMPDPYYSKKQYGTIVDRVVK